MLHCLDHDYISHDEPEQHPKAAFHFFNPNETSSVGLVRTRSGFFRTSSEPDATLSNCNRRIFAKKPSADQRTSLTQLSRARLEDTQLPSGSSLEPRENRARRFYLKCQLPFHLPPVLPVCPTVQLSSATIAVPTGTPRIVGLPYTRHRSVVRTASVFSSSLESSVVRQSSRSRVENSFGLTLSSFSRSYRYPESDVQTKNKVPSNESSWILRSVGYSREPHIPAGE